jgi:hypothetical protein
MASVVEPVVERGDVRTIIAGGVKLGILTAAAVVVFALMSRAVEGTIEVVLQSVLVLIGGVLASYLPALWVQPRSADSIGWASLVGLLGALVFTIVDTAVLRPLGVYHWTWDAIGGGSGFWYIPVWWMGSALLAWLGAWTAAIVGNARGRFRLPATVGLVFALTLVTFAAMVLLNVAPATPAVVALALVVGLVLCIPVTTVSMRR